MSNRKDKQLRRSVRKTVNDNSRRFLIAMLGSTFWVRLKWAVVILLRLGYKDLIIGGDDGIERQAH
jgi:hypothetical protein